MKYIYYFLFVSIVGTISHFVYNVSKSFVVKIFFPINESPFQHVKLIIFPSIILLIYELVSRNNDFYKVIAIYGIAIFLSIFFMLMFYYFIKCGLNINSLTIDILSFYITSFIFTFIIKYIIIENIFLLIIGNVLLILSITSSILFSFLKVNLPIFIENKKS